MNCVKCNDTGDTGQGYLDCVHCEVASEKAGRKARELPPLALWHAITDEAECIVSNGMKYLMLSEEMCVRLGGALEAQAAPAVPEGWRERLCEMSEASYTYSQHPELAHSIFDSVINALDDLEAATPPTPAQEQN